MDETTQSPATIPVQPSDSDKPIPASGKKSWLVPIFLYIALAVILAGNVYLYKNLKKVEKQNNQLQSLITQLSQGGELK